ncbi:MAG TPA: TetR/AcrR family transcriptional regulator [Solirubrobacteraceae bacterium]|jgi:AcrR family transcriptional regulator
MSLGTLTRKQRQQRTRELLLEAGAKVLAKHGLGASIDEVAARAGFTKGAFYANFKSKEDLFLAMLDERFGERLEQIERFSATDSEVGEQVRAAGEDFARYLAADPEWQRLFFELAAHAGRNRSFAERMVARCRELRAGIAGLIEGRAERLELPLPIPSDRIAEMLFMMGNGFALGRMLEPDLASEDMYGQMLQVFFAGLRAIAEEQQQSAGS